jgi:hypothetical protein
VNAETKWPKLRVKYRDWVRVMMIMIMMVIDDDEKDVVVVVVVLVLVQPSYYCKISRFIIEL